MNELGGNVSAPPKVSRAKDSFKADDTFFHDSRSYNQTAHRPSALTDNFEATLNDRSRGGD